MAELLHMGTVLEPTLQKLLVLERTLLLIHQSNKLLLLLQPHCGTSRMQAMLVEADGQ